MSSHRKLGFESLECRRVCAGNVIALIDDFGVLTITGDGAANYVNVQQQLLASQLAFVVTGKPFDGNFTAAGDPIASGAATTINGKTNFQAIATRVQISMNGGNDAVVLGGSGERVSVQELQIKTGGGSDYAKVTNAQTNVPDYATLFQMTGAVGTSADGLKEPGNDKLVISNFASDSSQVSLATGGGDDKILLSSINSGATMSIYAGTGKDTLSLANSLVQKFSAYMGSSAHADTVTMKTTSVSDLTVNLGAGDSDFLNIIGDFTSDKTTLRGGPGKKDRLRTSGVVELNGKTITGFELKPAGL